MSYSNPNVMITYEDTGAQLNFPINFYYLEGDPVIVAELWDYTDPTNPTQQSFVENIDYTIDESNYPDTEVVLASVVPADHKLIIYRSTLPIQLTSFANGAFPAESVEESIDKIAMVNQENTEILSRAILNPRHDPSAFTYSDLEDLANVSDDQETRITQAELDIITNANNISSNDIDIATNANAIAQNVLDIADNANDISTLQSQVALIVTPTIYSITAAETYDAVNANIVIIDTNDAVQVNLPAESANLSVTVKVSEKVGSKTVVAGTSIDGFGATYTLSSEYEAVKFICDGIKWYII
jgi:hypothetical protein